MKLVPIALSFPCQQSQIKESNLSFYLRITTVALAIITALSGAALLLLGLGSIAGLTMLSAGILTVLIGSVVRVKLQDEKQAKKGDIASAEKPQAKPKIEKDKSVENSSKSMDLAQIEGEFWEAFFNPEDRALSQFFEAYMLKALEKNRELKSTEVKIIVEKFAQMKDMELGSLNKKKLIQNVLFQIKRSFEKESPKGKTISADQGQMSNCYTIDDNQTLLTFSTYGDGSCGIYALIGQPDENGTYKCEAKKVRREFCKWLGEKQKAGTLPTEISSRVRGFLQEWDLTPSSLQKKDIKSFLTAFNSAESKFKKAKSKKEKVRIEAGKDRIRKRFEILIFPTYLKHLEQVGSYLYQEELIAFAQFAKKTLVLYQPGWGDEEDIVRGQTFNEGASDPVAVFFNGFNHYEHAQVLD